MPFADPRKQRYKKFRIQGMTKKAAALAAGYSARQAHNPKKEIEGPNFDLSSHLEAAGLTDKALAEHAVAGMNADKKVSLYYEKNSKEEGDESGYKEETVPDWQSRHKYFESVLKLRGKLKDNAPGIIDNSKHTHTHFTVIVTESLDGQAASNSKADSQTESRVPALNQP